MCTILHCMLKGLVPVTLRASYFQCQSSTQRQDFNGLFQCGIPTVKGILIKMRKLKINKCWGAYFEDSFLAFLN